MGCSAKFYEISSQLERHSVRSGADLTSNEILLQVQDVLRDVLDEDNLQIKPETTATDVDGWDSLNHVRIMISVEKAFNIRFSGAESKRLANVGDLIDLIKVKTGSK
jgi:acyl carrier protein